MLSCKFLSIYICVETFAFAEGSTMVSGYLLVPQYLSTMVPDYRWVPHSTFGITANHGIWLPQHPGTTAPGFLGSWVP